MTVTLAVVAGCAGLRQSAHSQLDSGGKDLSDKMLAYAMTIDLPEILVDSETVPLAPRASSLLQCARSGKGVSLSSAAPEPLGGCRGNVPSNLTIDPTRNSTTTTSLKGHSTESCVTRKRAEANKTKNKPQAKVAEAKDIPTAQWPDWTSTMTRGGSAYNTAAVPAIKSVPGIFIIDSGASHHMVTSSALLSDVKQTTPVSVKIGDGKASLSVPRVTHSWPGQVHRHPCGPRPQGQPPLGLADPVPVHLAFLPLLGNPLRRR
jgi:hypothetical protein